MTELRKKWVAALRSGEFKQCNNSLRAPILGNLDGDNVGYCCLGVLCELVHPDSEIIDDYQRSEELIPTEALGEYELTDVQQKRLAALNDGSTMDGMKIRKHTFSEIADYIEIHLDKVV